MGIKSEVRGGELGKGGVLVHVCDDCMAWAHDGEAIRHGKRCDSPDEQPEIREKALTSPSARKVASKALSAAEIKRRGRDGMGLTEDEAYDAQRRGIITMDEAMNRDD